jgi:hypothetical protein
VRAAVIYRIHIIAVKEKGKGMTVGLSGEATGGFEVGEAGGEGVVGHG